MDRAPRTDGRRAGRGADRAGGRELETLVGADLDPAFPPPNVPSFRIRIPDASFQTDYESPALAKVVLGQFKGGLDVIALLASLLVVPLVGQLMEESPVLVRGSVIGGMILAALVGAVVSGMTSRRRMEAVSTAAARATIARSIESSFAAQIDRFRSDVERACAASMQDALRVAMGVSAPAVAQFLARREAAAATMLAAAQLEIDQIDAQLRSLARVKSELEDELLLDLRRSLVRA